MAESNTVRPHATGIIHGDVGDHPYGLGRFEIRIDPQARWGNGEFRFQVDERFGPQITDHRDHRLHFSRRGAQELRDALTLALEWGQEETNG